MTTLSKRMIGGVLEAEDYKSLNQVEDLIILERKGREGKSEGRGEYIHPFQTVCKSGPYENESL